MKIIILTASIGDNKSTIPKCFTTTIGSVVLIEYLVRTLRLLNISPQDIYLATSKSTKWGSKKYHEIISSLGVNEIIIKKNSKFSFPTLVTSLKYFNSDNVLVINGDNYFKLSELEYLLDVTFSNSTALIQSRNTVTSKVPILEINKDKIKKIETSRQSKIIPWLSYYGAVFLKKKDVIKIKKSQAIDAPYMDHIVNVIKLNLHTKDIASLLERNDNYKLNELTGGSFAGLEKLILVQKKADKIGRDKLVREIKWLINLNKGVSQKFPKIISHQISKDQASYTMPWYPKDNLRKKIISGVFGLKDIEEHMLPILDFLWKNLYKQQKKNIHIDWVNKKHFQRFYNRFDQICKIQPFKDIGKLNKIEINGKNYQNLPQLIDWLKNFNDKYKIFIPNYLSQIHGDLHFQNILIGDNPNDFIIADPEGDYNGSDVFYDMGKLWHSFNGKYDLIHSGFSEIKMLSSNGSVFNLNYGPKYLVETYNSIEPCFIKLMKNYPISKDRNWILKTKFAEFMHFSSVMHFHLKFDKLEKTALTLYLSAILLGNNLIKQLKNYETG